MVQTDQFVVGADLEGLPVGQALRLANRHGLIAGATGTGKTVTLQRLIETFSDAGVAVFAADVKGDLCGLGAAGAPQGKVAERIASMPWLNHQPMAYPVTLWDVHGKSGHPLRTTLSAMGPFLLGALLELTDSQQAALYAAFKVADREGLLLLDEQGRQLARFKGSFNGLDSRAYAAMQVYRLPAHHLELPKAAAPLTAHTIAATLAA